MIRVMYLYQSQFRGIMLVGLASQIGWTENWGDSPDKRINFEGIYIIIDSNGGNTVLQNLHNKIPHRDIAIKKVKSYLLD